MLKGIIIQNEVKSAKGYEPKEILNEEYCAVIINDVEGIIYLWVGDNSNVIDRFKAARLAQMLNWKIFGGAARVVQDKSEIHRVLTKYARIDEEIPPTELKLILG